MSLAAFDTQHMKNIAQNMRATQSAFTRFANAGSQIYERAGLSHPFDINQHPEIKRAIERELRKLASGLNRGLVNGINNEWQLSNRKNDWMLETKLRGRRLPGMLEEKWMGRNLSALEAFRNRTVNGLNLSDRVWDMARVHGTNMERHLALGVYEGRSAKELAGEIKSALKNPDTLFRRVRDNQGELRLSKTAKEFNPGRGVYRSAYKNALRLTRTEINLSYQHADNERWKEMDFVLGVRVERSNAPYECDICEAAVGDYPKWYEWDSLHPSCRCRAVPILASDDDFIRSLEAGFEGKSYNFAGQVQDIPQSFKDLQENTNYQHYGH